MMKIGSRSDHPSWSSSGSAVGKIPLVIGHRGASAVAPENSLASFKRALLDGADGIELDVLLSATGDVVVFHDDDLIRLGGRPERIADLPLGAIREVRLFSGASIPTLEEVFETCGDAMLVNVEVKAAGVSPGGVRALVDRVATVIERAGGAVAERVLVSSFHPGALRLWRRRSPGIRTGLLFERAASLPLRRAWALPWLRPFSVHPENVLCTAQAVRRWHSRGYRVNVWTVDESAELGQFADMKVDAIITNNPARSRSTLTAR